MNIFNIKKTVNQHEKKKTSKCIYGQKSTRFVKMHKKKYFQINKEKILEIQKVRKESAFKKIRVTQPYYYNINKRLQFLSKIVNITTKKTK
jgi:hypothetical protein